MDVVQSGISNVLAYAVLAIIVGLILFDCRRDIRQLVSARNVFLLTLICWFVIEALLAPKVLEIFSQDTFDTGVFCVLLCTCSFLAAYSSVHGGVFDPVFRRLESLDNPRLLRNIFFAACFVGFLPMLYMTTGNPIPILEDAFLSRARWSGTFARGRYGGAQDAFMELQMFLRAAIPLAAALFVSKKQAGLVRTFAFLFLVYSFARALNSGARSQVAEVFLPVAAALYWRFPATWKRRALFFGIPIIAVLGLMWSAASVVTRNSGKFEWDAAYTADYVGFEMFRELLYLIEAVPEHSHYKLGHTYYVQAVNPIPRAIWPGKPDNDAGLELARLKGMVSNGQAYLTVAPGLIGEMYWNGGYVCILLVSAVMGYLAKSWDRARAILSRSVLAFTVFAAGLAIIFLSGRSINMPTLYGMISLFFLLIFLGRRGRRLT